ncbi:transglycosylase SLT domain-containing protein [Ferrimicrobium acidiphilum]|uniref:transglycosylase SLT domain-containing protein n=1 Tax=Ferrimicrobium acidiphilum TaxID=121039 RepID=UPI0023F3E48F|nr:transglycosylase SLT domain-containing protein [Ferrimicrobium acidiphilum]
MAVQAAAVLIIKRKAAEKATKIAVRVVIALATLTLALALFVVAFVAGAAQAFGGPTPTGVAHKTIPPNLLASFMAASLWAQTQYSCGNMEWNILAGVAMVESGMDVNTRSSSAGAEGLMQFEPGTFAGRVPMLETINIAGGDTPPTITNPYDAIYAAAITLCDYGINKGNINDAIGAYNCGPGGWYGGGAAACPGTVGYISNVLGWAAEFSTQYTSATQVTIPSTNLPQGPQAPSATTQLAVRLAQQAASDAQSGEGGMTVQMLQGAGLINQTYGALGYTVGPTVQATLLDGPVVNPQTLAEGDLVFFGTPNNPMDVGICLSNANGSASVLISPTQSAQAPKVITFTPTIGTGVSGLNTSSVVTEQVLAVTAPQ